MRFIRGLQNLPRDWRGCALTIGNFDGMHRGHQALIARTREWADKLGVPLAVMCFEPTPREYFTPEQAPTRVTNLPPNLHAFAAAAADAATIQLLGPPLSTPGGSQLLQ